MSQLNKPDIEVKEWQRWHLKNLKYNRPKSFPFAGKIISSKDTPDNAGVSFFIGVVKIGICQITPPLIVFFFTPYMHEGYQTFSALFLSCMAGLLWSLSTAAKMRL